jgi:hypothetical protein
LLDAALQRAFAAARDVPVAYAVDPWRFTVLASEGVQAVAWLNARVVEAAVGPEEAQAAYEQWRSVPGWVIVSCLRDEDPERMAYLEERCLTAVQRVALSLWSENVRTSWVTDAVVQEERFYALAGLDPAAEAAVGILWFGHAERGEGT